jgi:hypothetical protein
MESFVGTFKYQPLDSDTNTIRVVTLEPGDFESPIHCTLQHIDLDIHSRYEALSYVWGDPKLTIPIHIESDATFPVTKNLERALRYLRIIDSPRVLWIDAISIDQSNMPERNQQVQKMAEIYESASKVLLWVGEEEDVGSFGSPSPIPIPYVFTYLAKVTAIVKAPPGGEPPPMVYDPYEDHWMDGLMSFEGRAWFKRLW